MENLEKRIQRIEERNKSVEKDKAWETSKTRRVLLLLFTYIAIAVYLWIIDVSRPFLNAVVPAVAFVISTMILQWFKNIWMRK